jgi:hypothetical protein
MCHFLQRSNEQEVLPFPLASVLFLPSAFLPSLQRQPLLFFSLLLPSSLHPK